VLPPFLLRAALIAPIWLKINTSCAVGKATAGASPPFDPAVPAVARMIA
jgi:hypothetical protein